MYSAIADPYCYAGTSVLRNVPGIRDQGALDTFEAISTAQRSDEPLPEGRLSVSHYCAIHRHIFQDVFAWSGKFRTVRISKDGSAFCYPENIAREMKALFSDLKRRHYFRALSRDEFVVAVARFLGTLNAIHAFREGNGRTQTIFLALLADHAGHPIDLNKLNPLHFWQLWWRVSTATNSFSSRRCGGLPDRNRWRIWRLRHGWNSRASAGALNEWV